MLVPWKFNSLTGRLTESIAIPKAKWLIFQNHHFSGAMVFFGGWCKGLRGHGWVFWFHFEDLMFFLQTNITRVDSRGVFLCTWQLQPTCFPHRKKHCLLSIFSCYGELYKWAYTRMFHQNTSFYYPYCMNQEKVSLLVQFMRFFHIIEKIGSSRCNRWFWCFFLGLDPCLYLFLSLMCSRWGKFECCMPSTAEMLEGRAWCPHKIRVNQPLIRPYVLVGVR